MFSEWRDLRTGIIDGDDSAKPSARRALLNRMMMMLDKFRRWVSDAFCGESRTNFLIIYCTLVFTGIVLIWMMSS